MAGMDARIVLIVCATVIIVAGIGAYRTYMDWRGVAQTVPLVTKAFDGIGDFSLSPDHFPGKGPLRESEKMRRQADLDQYERARKTYDDASRDPDMRSLSPADWSQWLDRVLKKKSDSDVAWQERLERIDQR